MNKKKQLLTILFIFSCIMIAHSNPPEKGRAVITPYFRLELPESMTMHRCNYYHSYFFLEEWEEVSLNYDFYTQENPFVVTENKEEKANPFLSFCVVKDLIARDEVEARSIASGIEDSMAQGFEESEITVHSKFYSPHTFSENHPYPVLEVQIEKDGWTSPSWFVFTPEGTGFLILHNPDNPEIKDKYKDAVTDMITSLRLSKENRYDELFKRSSNELPFKTPARWGEPYIGAYTPYNQEDLVEYKEFRDQYDPDMPVSFMMDRGVVSIVPCGWEMALSEPEILHTMIEEVRKQYGKKLQSDKEGTLSLPAEAHLDFRSCFDLLANDYFPDSRIHIDRNEQRLMLSLDLYSPLEEDEEEDEEDDDEEDTDAGFTPGLADSEQVEGMFYWQRLVVTPHNMYIVAGIYFSLPGQGKAMQQFKADFEEVLNTIKDVPLKSNEWLASFLQLIPSGPLQKEYNETDYPLLSYPLGSDHYTFDRISTNERYQHHFFYHRKEKVYIVETQKNYSPQSWYNYLYHESDLSCKAYDEDGNFIKEIPSIHDYNLADLIEYKDGEWLESDDRGYAGSGRFMEKDLLKATRRYDLFVQDPGLLFYSSPRGNSSRPSQWNAQLFNEIPLEKETVRFSYHTFDDGVFVPLGGHAAKINHPTRYTDKKGPIFVYLPPAADSSGKWENGGLFIVRKK